MTRTIGPSSPRGDEISRRGIHKEAAPGGRHRDIGNAFFGRKGAQLHRALRGQTDITALRENIADQKRSSVTIP